jgi:predicted porin
MNKKLLALAVTSALAGVSAGVNADTANVNVYGKLWIQAQSISGKGATVPGGDIVSRTEINDPNSYVGFKGEDNLGGGMKGWFQVEQAILAETGGGTWSSRNTAVGLSGGFGNVFLGNWDTVYKQLGDPVSFLGISSGNFVSTSNVLSKRFDGAGAASFHLRRANYLEYDSPTMSGVTVMAGYSPDEARTGSKNAYLQSIGVKYEQGPLYVALANEMHNDFFGTATVDSKDTATRLSGKYALPSGTTLGIDISNLEYKLTSGGASTKGKNTTMSFVATQAMGNLTLAGGVVIAGKFKIDGTEVPDSEAQQFNLGVSYAFSKRTSVYAIYAKLTNKDNAAFDNVINGAVNAGVDPEQIAVGVAVSF